MGDGKKKKEPDGDADEAAATVFFAFNCEKKCSLELDSSSSLGRVSINDSGTFLSKGDLGTVLSNYDLVMLLGIKLKAHSDKLCLTRAAASDECNAEK